MLGPGVSAMRHERFQKHKAGKRKDTNGSMQKGKDTDKSKINK